MEVNFCIFSALLFLFLQLSTLHYSYCFIHGFAYNSGSFILVTVYYSKTYISIFMLMGICVVSSLGLLQIVLLWLLFQYFIDRMHAFLLGIYLGVELQRHSMYIISFSRQCKIVLQNSCTSILPPAVWGFQLLHILGNTWYFFVCLNFLSTEF